ncbi:hypothetical protein HDU86_004407 [Geranomyces michiganensis]|nr:hypothetical protein HDU86_004407 [Geranomyces michiganensis]
MIDSGFSSGDDQPKRKQKRSRSGAGDRDGQQQAKSRTCNSNKAPSFTTEEDELLIELHAKHSGDFKAIGIEFNERRGRSLKQLRQRYFNYMAAQKKKQVKKQKE